MDVKVIVTTSCFSIQAITFLRHPLQNAQGGNPYQQEFRPCRVNISLYSCEETRKFMDSIVEENAT